MQRSFSKILSWLRHNAGFFFSDGNLNVPYVSLKILQKIKSPYSETAMASSGYCIWNNRMCAHYFFKFMKSYQFIVTSFNLPCGGKSNYKFIPSCIELFKQHQTLTFWRPLRHFYFPSSLIIDPNTFRTSSRPVCSSHTWLIQTPPKSHTVLELFFHKNLTLNKVLFHILRRL
jgi:hypothetical protein